MHGFRDDETRARGGVQHALGLCGVCSKRFLAEHVLSCIDGFHAPVRVHADGQGYVHRVDIGVREKLIERAVGPWDAMLARVALESLGGLVLFANRDEVHGFELMGVPDQGKRCDPGGAQNA